MTPDMLPEWWTNSAVYEYLRGGGRHYWIAHWNHVFAAMLVLASTRRLKGIRRKWTVRPSVLMGTMLSAQLLIAMFGFFLLDRGQAYYYGSAFWGVVAMWYAAFMWALRRQTLREQAVPEPVAIMQPGSTS